MTGRKRVQFMLAFLVCLWARCLAQDESTEVVPVGTLKLDALYELSFTPDGAFLGVATYHGVFLYTVPDLEQTRSFSLPGIAYSLAFSPDGHYLAAGTCSAACVWDFLTGEPVATCEGNFGNVYTLAFTPDSRHLLIGTGEGTLILWEVGAGEPLWTRKAHSGSIRGVAVSPDGTLLASGSMDQGILWNRSGEVLFTFPGKAWCTAFSPDAYFLAMGAGKVVKLWDTAVGLCYRSMWKHTGCVWWVEFSPNGRLLASASLDHTVRLWDPEEGECLAVLSAHEDSVECVRFSPDGRFLASGSGDGVVFLWDLSALLSGGTWPLNQAFPLERRRPHSHGRRALATGVFPATLASRKAWTSRRGCGRTFSLSGRARPSSATSAWSARPPSPCLGFTGPVIPPGRLTGWTNA